MPARLWRESRNSNSFLRRLSGLAHVARVENLVAIRSQLVDFGLQLVHSLRVPAPQSLSLLRMQVAQSVVHIEQACAFFGRKHFNPR